MNQKWYVLYAGDVRKHLGIENFFHSLNPDFKVWSPTQNVLGKFRNQDVIKAQPIFPGYLFVNGDIPAGLDNRIQELGGKLLAAPGCENPQEIDLDFIVRIKSLEAQEDIEKVVEQTFDLVVGDQVEITNGPFLSGIGVIKQVKKGKIVVELEIMSRYVEIEFEPQQCFKLS